MKISIQTGDVVDRLGFERGYKEIKRAGFDAVDWNLDHAWKHSDIREGTYEGTSILEKEMPEITAYYAGELEIMRKAGITVTQAHAPFPPYTQDHPGALDWSIACYKKLIKFCGTAECKNLVIHGISSPLVPGADSAEKTYALNGKMYLSLIPEALEAGVTVCLENLFTSNGGYCGGHCSDAKKAADFIDYLNGEAGSEVFGLCFDTGHANLLRTDIRDYIQTLGGRIKCLHVHDNDGCSDEHLAPFTGTVKWKLLCEELGKINYRGDISFETFRQTNIVMDYSPEAVFPWLSMIAAMGNLFKQTILGKGE